MSAHLPFDPTASLKDGIEVVPDATLYAYLPNERGTAQIVAGVLDAQGHPVEQSICWRNERHPKTLLPEPSAAADVPLDRRVLGRWVFGGVLYGHFGHFLCESIARLWALDHLDDVDGVVFIPKKDMTHPRRAIDPALPWLAAMGLTVPAIGVGRQALQFDELVIPPQGFGTGAMMAGAPEFRAYMHQRLQGKGTSKSASKIYISRSKLFSKRGRYLGEERLEELLTAQGYTIFHPQEHDLDAQIALYRSADVILSSDNSALHLAAFCVSPSTRIGIIRRRTGALIEDFLTQFDWIAGIQPDVFDVLQPHHFRFGPKRRNRNEIFTELDFEELGRQLREAGYISPAKTWGALDDEDLRAECAVLAEKLGAAPEKVPL